MTVRLRRVSFAGILLCACLPLGAQLPASRTEASRAAITDFVRILAEQKKPFDAFRKYFAPGQIQHDPWIADGNGGDEDFLEKRRKAEPEKYQATDQFANVTHMIMADGDLVAVKSHVFTSPQDHGRVFVDIGRVQNGKFVEHWDVIQPMADMGPNVATVSCGKGATYAEARALTGLIDKPVCGLPDRSSGSESNRKLVLDYMTMGQQPGRLAEAINTYLADDFVQHSPHIPPGRQGLLDYMSARADARRADNRRSHFARTLADGDLVLVHRRVVSDSNPRGTAAADLFRLRGGKIVEHWDVIQPIPAFSVSGRSMVDGPLEPGRTKRPPNPGE